MARQTVERFVLEDSEEYRAYESQQNRYAETRNRFYGIGFLRGLQSSQQSIIDSNQELACIEEETQRLSSLLIKTRTTQRRLKELSRLSEQWNETIAFSKHRIETFYPNFAKTELIDLLETIHKYIASFDQAEIHKELPKRLTFVLQELQYMFDGNVVGTETPGTLRWFEEMRSHINTESFDPQIALAVLTRHVEGCEARERTCGALFEKTKAEFKTRIEEQVAAGRIPATALDNLKRLETMPVVLFDRLMGDLHGGTMAQHSRFKGVSLYIDELEDAEKVRSTLFHEFIHAIAGTAAHALEMDRYASVHPIAIRKQGVSFPRQSRLERTFLWLDEAYTEWLALELSGYRGTGEEDFEGSDAYIDERKELRCLFDLGLEPEVVADAYFENITSTQEPKTRAAGFVRLVQRINEVSQDPAAFNKLEYKFFFKRIIAPALLGNGIVPQEIYETEDEFLAANKLENYYAIEFTYGNSARVAYTAAFYTGHTTESAASAEAKGVDPLAFIDGVIKDATRGLRQKLTWQIREIKKG